MFNRRIAVTGLGIYAPLGTDKERFFENLLQSRTVILDVSSIIPLLKTGRVQIGSLFSEDQLDYQNIGLDKKEAKHRMSHFSRIAFGAAKEAVEDSGIFHYNPDETKERTGVSVGGGFGGLSDIEKSAVEAMTKDGGLANVDRFIAAKTIPGSASAFIANHYRLHAGDAAALVSECASGASNIIYGAMNIHSGLADAWICGGTGDAFSYLTFAGFDRLGALSRRNNEPERASRPFDRDRDGFIIGDGAGIIVLEELMHAKKRGAKIYAELCGFGSTLDGDHPTSPREDAKYATLALKQAMDMAGINPDEIDYINAHGTSTKNNDWSETMAIKQAFGEYAYKIPINSTKSMTGHTLNAAGALEAIVTVMSIHKGVIHPTKNLENPDIKDTGEQGFVACDLYYVPDGPKEKTIRHALSNSFAFGGRNVVLCFGKYK